MEEINIIVSLHQRGNDNYLRACAAMYASIRTHTKARLVFHLIHDETVSKESLNLLSEFISQQDQISLIDINSFPEIAAIGREYGLPPYSPAVIWRVYLVDICQLSKAIVLDVDLIFLCDISDLWRSKLDGMALAASLRGKPLPEDYLKLIGTSTEKYFRNGVLVMNLDYIRNDLNFIENRDHFLKHQLPELNKIAYLQEQTLYNYFFSHACLPLDINLCSAARVNISQEEVEACLLRISNLKNVILDVKGWTTRSPLVYFYWSYLLFTPWRNQAFEFLSKQQRLAN